MWPPRSCGVQVRQLLQRLLHSLLARQGVRVNAVRQQQVNVGLKVVLVLGHAIKVVHCCDNSNIVFYSPLGHQNAVPFSSALQYLQAMKAWSRRLALVAVGLLWGTALLAPAAAVADSGPQVETSNGPVVGAVDDGIEAFKGIPYAAAPVGDLRYEAPQPAADWTQPLDATNFGPGCMQTPDEIENDPSTPLSEDCLTVNVWTPDASGGSRPVLVWIHGGGFSWGTASHPLYDGRNLAERGDMVVVSLQYRLGSFGWLDLSEAGGPASSANNGLLDMSAALKWVRENAAAFGGDAGNITVAGESAGAIALGSLLTTKQAEGLFDRAILQSGSPGLVMTDDVAADLAQDFIGKAGASTVEDLRAMSTEELLAAQLSFEQDSAFADVGFHPVIDGVVLEQGSTVAVRDGLASTVPVLIGTTRDESRYWLLYYDYLDRLPLSYAEPWLDAISGGRSAEINDAFLTDRPELSDGQLMMATATSTAFTMPAIRFSEALSSRDSPVWMYLFTIPSNQLDGRMGSPHAMELPFMFGNLDAEPALLDPSEDRQRYEEDSALIQDAWIAFARDGDPSTKALGPWPMYDAATRTTMVFGSDETSLVSDPNSVERTVWADIPFDGLTPPLLQSNPLTAEQTEVTIPVVMAVIGPVWTAVVIAGLVAVIVLIVAAVVWWVRRRRRKRTVETGPVESHADMR